MRIGDLEDVASGLSTLLSFLHGRGNNCSDGFIKYSFQSLLSQGRAFHITDRRDLFGFGHSLFVGDGRVSSLSQSLDGFSIVSQIQFGSNQDDGSIGAMVGYFRVPFG